MPKVEGTWRNRQLLLLGRISRMGPNKHPRFLISLMCTSKRSRGRHFRTIRESLAGGLKSLMKYVDEKEDAVNGCGHAE